MQRGWVLAPENLLMSVLKGPAQGWSAVQNWDFVQSIEHQEPQLAEEQAPGQGKALEQAQVQERALERELAPAMGRETESKQLQNADSRWKEASFLQYLEFLA